MSTSVRVGTRVIELTHPDKPYYPRDGLTKKDVVAYYRSVAEHVLRHAEGRPLTLQRFPDGIDGEGFYQKQAPESVPEWLPRIRVPLADGSSQTQLSADDEASLVFLVQRGALSFHTWSSRRGHLQQPDRIVFDLDPPSADDFALVRDTARALRRLLEDVGLPSFVMVTGSTGMHVRVPIRRGPGFDRVREFARSVVRALAESRPDTTTTEVRKEKRRGRLFLDVARNALGQTAIAPYSLRPRDGAPVATPLDWNELGRIQSADRYTMSALLRRMGQRDDPWRAMDRSPGDLTQAAEAWSQRRAST
jgi:bifunctional non-homologous end joining protein LigD